MNRPREVEALGRGLMTELQGLDLNLQQMVPDPAEAAVPVSVCPAFPLTLPFPTLAIGQKLCFTFFSATLHSIDFFYL